MFIDSERKKYTRNEKTKLIGIIDKNGYILIKRGPEYKQQYCPYNTSQKCGDWCPMLEEPMGFKVIKLHNCRKVLHFSELCDKRNDKK